MMCILCTVQTTQQGCKSLLYLTVYISYREDRVAEPLRTGLPIVVEWTLSFSDEETTKHLILSTAEQERQFRPVVCGRIALGCIVPCGPSRCDRAHFCDPFKLSYSDL